MIGAIYFGRQRKRQEIMMLIVEYFIQCVVQEMDIMA